MHIGFLFNHRHHQVFHSVGVAFALASHYPDIKVTIIAANAENFFLIKKLGEQFPSHRASIIQSESYRPVAILHQALKGWFSLEKLIVRSFNQELFRQLDALVVSEYTSLSLRHTHKKLLLMQIPHGAGDREVSFDKRIREFDLVLLPGEKMRDRLAELGRLPSEKNYAITGYPKFDLLADKQAVRYFDNDRLTVLYNPHFSPALSSWHRMGPAVLDYFYHSKKFNLLFAPHIMLFERRWKNKAGCLSQRYADCPHMLIDTGSQRSSDMTYTLCADLYLGDVSSQVYEFLLRPRPCIFLNAHQATWRDNPYYYHWQFGRVLDDINTLDAALNTAWETHDKYKQRQKQAFAYTFARTTTPSSLRAARKIVDFLQSTRQSDKQAP